MEGAEPNFFFLFSFSLCSPYLYLYTLLYPLCRPSSTVCISKISLLTLRLGKPSALNTTYLNLSGIKPLRGAFEISGETVILNLPTVYSKSAPFCVILVYSRFVSFSNGKEKCLSKKMKFFQFVKEYSRRFTLILANMDYFIL
jgi:hypothetical protein